jgi:hypothetical protein
MHYKFSEVERDLLLDLAIDRAARHGLDHLEENLSIKDRAANRATLTAWCRIIGELSAPTPLTDDDFPRETLSAYMDEPRPRDSEQEQQRESARREGLDFDKEFGPIDPRARTPRCVHGKLFSEACPICEGRCAHGLTQLEPCAACGRGVLPAEQPGTFDPL